MSYGARKNSDGEMLVYPLELPLYEGNNSELGQQAIKALCSCLRHYAVYDAFHDEGLIDNAILDGYEADAAVKHFNQGTEQLISCMMSLASIADNYGIDIMREIFEIPWLV